MFREKLEDLGQNRNLLFQFVIAGIGTVNVETYWRNYIYWSSAKSLLKTI
jgi:hypothetical protein